MLIDPTCTLGSVPNVFVATKIIFNDFTIKKKIQTKKNNLQTGILNSLFKSG